MLASIAVWYLIIYDPVAGVKPTQLGPYYDVASCTAVSDMKAADNDYLLDLRRGCIQVNVPAYTLLK